MSARSRAPGGHAVAFVAITVLIDTIGFGLIMPVMPTLLMELTGTTVSRAAIYGGWLTTLYAVTQFLFAPILGNLSDRFGRRPVLLAAIAALGVDYLILGFAPTIGWLFLGRAIAGMAGASFTPAYAYVADITPPERRAQNFGIVAGAFGVGFILGPALGGLLGGLGSRAPFFAAAGLSLLNFAYGFFVLAESLPPERRRLFPGVGRIRSAPSCRCASNRWCWGSSVRSFSGWWAIRSCPPRGAFTPPSASGGRRG